MLLGDWCLKNLPTSFTVNSNNIRLLGIDFGNSGLNYANLMTKMRSKIEYYRNHYNHCSLLVKAKILNVFVLPISYYHLKALHPPKSFFEDVHKMVCDFIWEGKRHWVKPLFIYAPVENGSLGVKNSYTQHLIFKFRALQKRLSSHQGDYFLIRKLKTIAFDFFFSNTSDDPNFSSILPSFSEINLKFSHMSKPNFQLIKLSQRVRVTSFKFPHVSALGLQNISDVLGFKLV